MAEKIADGIKSLNSEINVKLFNLAKSDKNNEGIKVMWQPDTESMDQCTEYGKAFVADL